MKQVNLVNLSRLLVCLPLLIALLAIATGTHPGSTPREAGLTTGAFNEIVALSLEG